MIEVKNRKNKIMFALKSLVLSWINQPFQWFDYFFRLVDFSFSLAKSFKTGIRTLFCQAFEFVKQRLLLSLKTEYLLGQVPILPYRFYNFLVFLYFRYFLLVCYLLLLSAYLFLLPLQLIQCLDDWIFRLHKSILCLHLFNQICYWDLFLATRQALFKIFCYFLLKVFFLVLKQMNRSFQFVNQLKVKLLQVQKGLDYDQKINRNQVAQKMSKLLFQLQEQIKNLRDEISDTLHLAFLNHQSYLCLNKKEHKSSEQALPNSQQQKKIQSKPSEPLDTQSQKTLQKQRSLQVQRYNTEIEIKLQNIPKLFEKRTQNHLNFLIVKQIQGQQESVRRDRLTEYEQKIYDQRRLISDKEVFLESLLRPKKQRPEGMTAEQFQQLRLTQKVEQEKAKLAALDQEIKKLQTLRNRISEAENRTNRKAEHYKIKERQLQIYHKIKNQDLQKTKAHSLETVNLSAVNNLGSEKLQKPFEEEDINSNGQQLASEKSKDSSSIKQGSLSEKTLGKQKNSLPILVYIQKLIQNYEKDVSAEEAKQKYDKIRDLLAKIKEKKEKNKAKNKQWKGLQMENAHLKAHLKKTKQLYIEGRKNP